MFAAYAARIDPDQPLDGLELGDRPAPEARPGWSTVTVRAASLNHHDLWSLRGVGLSQDRLPMILGCDAARRRPGRQRGRPALRHRAVGARRRAEGAPLHPHGALPGHLRRTGHRPRLERAAQAEGAQLRGGRLSADRLAHRVPDAVHQRRGAARRLRARPGRRMAVSPPPRSSSGRPPGCGSSPPAGTRPSASGPSNSARWRRTSPAPGCRSGWTPSSRPSAPPPGPTP